MAIKTYILLEHTKPVAPIFNVVNKQRIRVSAMPSWRPNLQYTFADEKDKNVTIRFKLNSNTILQDEQIKDGNIPANAKFSTTERNLLKFRGGVLAVKNEVAQKFLEAAPHFDGFKGTASEPVTAFYTLYDKKSEVKKDNKLFKKTVSAANKIMKLDVEAAKDLLIRINGVGYTPPEDLDEAQNVLVEYMDTSEEALDEILKKVISDKESSTLLIGKLVAKDILSFDKVDGSVAKKKGNQWVSIKDGLSATDFSIEQRHEMFADFLTSEAGEALRESLEEEL